MVVKMDYVMEIWWCGHALAIGVGGREAVKGAKKKRREDYGGDCGFELLVWFCGAGAVRFTVWVIWFC
jgi:hypothetical protein